MDAGLHAAHSFNYSLRKEPLSSLPTPDCCTIFRSVEPRREEEMD